MKQLLFNVPTILGILSVFIGVSWMMHTVLVKREAKSLVVSGIYLILSIIALAWIISNRI